MKFGSEMKERGCELERGGKLKNFKKLDRREGAGKDKKSKDVRDNKPWIKNLRKRSVGYRDRSEGTS